MKIRRSLFFNLSWRLVLIITTALAIAVLAFRMLERETIFTLLVGLILLVLQVYFLGRYLFRIQRVLVSFVDSVGSVDAPELQFSSSRSILYSLESRLNQLKTEVTRSRIEQQKQKGFLDIVVDTMEIALICMNQQQEVVFSNKAFHSLVKDRTVSSFKEIERLNPGLADALRQLSMDTLTMAVLPQFKASVRSKSFILEQQEHTLYSIQNIQREADLQETESWQKLIRVLTHEIMNSMGPVISLSKSLTKSVNQPEKILEGLNTIENTGEGLTQFIKEYRKLSLLPPPEKKYFSVSTLFKQTEALFGEEVASGNIIFKNESGHPEAMLHADPHQIGQILINLIKNAFESMRHTEDGTILVTAYRTGNRMELQVEDNGPGIPEEIQEHIFIPFFSTKSGGTGIGLSLSRQIMNGHGGTIQFSSVPNQKTVFTLIF